MNRIPKNDNYAVGNALRSPDIEYLPSLKRVRTFLGGQILRGWHTLAGGRENGIELRRDL
jgi:hypothetical protein